MPRRTLCGMRKRIITEQILFLEDLFLKKEKKRKKRKAVILPDS